MTSAIAEWTPERVALLREAYAAGTPWETIADQIGTTVNAAKAKARKIGIEFGRIGPGHPSTFKLVPARKQSNGGITTGADIKRIAEKRAVAVATEDQKPLLASDAWTDRPGSVALLDLRDRHCRWPLGKTPFRFCGCQVVVGESYCAAHYAVSIGAGTRSERQAA